MRNPRNTAKGYYYGQTISSAGNASVLAVQRTLPKCFKPELIQEGMGSTHIVWEKLQQVVQGCQGQQGRSRFLKTLCQNHQHQSYLCSSPIILVRNGLHSNAECQLDPSRNQVQTNDECLGSHRRECTIFPSDRAVMKPPIADSLL